MSLKSKHLYGRNDEFLRLTKATHRGVQSLLLVPHSIVGSDQNFHTSEKLTPGGESNATLGWVRVHDMTALKALCSNPPRPYTPPPSQARVVH